MQIRVALLFHASCSLLFVPSLNCSRQYIQEPGDFEYRRREYPDDKIRVADSVEVGGATTSGV